MKFYKLTTAELDENGNVNKVNVSIQSEKTLKNIVLNPETFVELTVFEQKKDGTAITGIDAFDYNIQKKCGWCGSFTCDETNCDTARLEGLRYDAAREEAIRQDLEREDSE